MRSIATSTFGAFWPPLWRVFFACFEASELTDLFTHSMHPFHWNL